MDFPGGSELKCLVPPVRETWVRSLGQEDPLEKEMVTHSSILAWRIPWMEKPGRLQSTGVAKSRTRLSDFTFTFHFHALEKEMSTHSSVLAWRIPGTGSLVGCCLWGRKGSEVKVSASNAGDPGLIPGSGRYPGEGNGYPLQYSCLENPMDGEAW